MQDQCLALQGGERRQVQGWGAKSTHQTGWGDASRQAAVMPGCALKAACNADQAQAHELKGQPKTASHPADHLPTITTQ